MAAAAAVVYVCSLCLLVSAFVLSCVVLPAALFGLRLPMGTQLRMVCWGAVAVAAYAIASVAS